MGLISDSIMDVAMRFQILDTKIGDSLRRTPYLPAEFSPSFDYTAAYPSMIEPTPDANVFKTLPTKHNFAQPKPTQSLSQRPQHSSVFKSQFQPQWTTSYSRTIQNPGFFGLDVPQQVNFEIIFSDLTLIQQNNAIVKEDLKSIDQSLLELKAMPDDYVKDHYELLSEQATKGQTDCFKEHTAHAAEKSMSCGDEFQQVQEVSEYENVIQTLGEELGIIDKNLHLIADEVPNVLPLPPLLSMPMATVPEFVPEIVLLVCEVSTPCCSEIPSFEEHYMKWKREPIDKMSQDAVTEVEDKVILRRNLWKVAYLIALSPCQDDGMQIWLVGDALHEDKQLKSYGLSHEHENWVCINFKATDSALGRHTITLLSILRCWKIKKKSKVVHSNTGSWVWVVVGRNICTILPA